MATNQKLQIPVYTYEFMPVEKPQNTLFESKECLFLNKVDSILLLFFNI